MNTLKFENKWFPNLGISEGESEGKALRVVNIDTNSGLVKVTGGRSAIYNDDTSNTDVNILQYRRKGAPRWSTVPNDGVQLSCAQGAYIDFRYKHIQGQQIEMNYNLNGGVGQKYTNISTNMSAELSGELDALQLDDSQGSNKFHSLFYNGNKYIHASALILPSNLGAGDYEQLFEDCASLRTPPDCSNFPVNGNVSNETFAFMFKNCGALLSGLRLNPTYFIGDSCCKQMYHNCRNMTHPGSMCVKSMGVTSNNSQFQQMYCNCINLTFVNTISFEADYASDSCCEYMFQGCTYLTGTVPLPMTNLHSECYLGMYADCTHLTDVPYNYLTAATTMAIQCYDSMFSGCTTLSAGPHLSVVTADAKQCFQNMFNNCKALLIDGGLSFANINSTLHYGSFYKMYENCWKINPISVTLPSVTQAADDYIFAYMFHGCSSMVVFPELPYTKIGAHCYEGMFANCKGMTSAPELNITLSTNLADSCYHMMFSGCANLTYIKCMQQDWFKIPIANELITKDWVNGVSLTGEYECNSTIASDSTKLLYNQHHIPFNDDHKWTVRAELNVPAFTRYQDRTSNLKSQWAGLSAYDSSGNQDTDFGFYRDNSLNHILGTGSSNETIVIHFSQKGSGGSVAYPWANPTRYTVTTQGGLLTSNLINNIAMDNTNHCFTFTSYLGEGVYPTTNLSGLYNPIQLTCQYSYQGVTQTRVINFVFVCDEENASNTNANVLLLGGTGPGNITIDGIPTANDSRVMIKKFNKSDGKSTTDWCDVTGYKKVVVPLTNSEWLGVKNGALDLKLETRDGHKQVSSITTARGTIHIETSRSTGGIISGNVRGMGSPYFTYNDLYKQGGGSVNAGIHLWGTGVLKGMFSGTTFQTVSPTLMYNCNVWSATSGCAQMFSGCNVLTSTPNIYSNQAQGSWNEYMFYQMFCKAKLDNIITNPINSYGTIWDTCAGARMFAGTQQKGYQFQNPLSGTNSAFSAMFQGCTKLLGDYTDSLYVDSIWEWGCAAMFSGCTNLVTFSGNFNWSRLGTTYDSGNDGGFSAAFKDCTSLYSFSFSGNTLYLQNQYFTEMFMNDVSLATVSGLNIAYGATSCCKKMFAGCTDLSNADVSITQDGDSYSYQYMFSGCTSLPRISLVNLTGTAEGCCWGMFQGCTSFTNNNNKINLTNNTHLGCYKYMFLGCTNLFISPNVIEHSPITTYDTNTNTNRNDAFVSMFYGCRSLTDFNLRDMVYYYNNPAAGYSTYQSMFYGCQSLNFSFSSPYYAGADAEFDDLPVVCAAGPSNTVAGMFDGCTSLEYTPIMICVSNSYNKNGSCWDGTFNGCTGLKKAILIFSPKEKSLVSQSNFIGPFGQNTWASVTDKTVTILTNVTSSQYSFVAKSGEPGCAWTQTDTSHWDNIIDWSKINQSV